MVLLFDAIDWFFHARTGEKSCVLCGYIRIFYAFLILCDKALWTIDFEFFFLSGRLPYEATSKDSSLANSFTIFALAPESDFLYLVMHVLNMVSAGLLLLGIAPRLQLVLVHFCFLSFQHHNAIIWDGEDAMFRVWNFLMMFLPLHRVTIYDLLSTTDKYRATDPKEDSWPMWPFRLWQIEICFVYAGAAMGKLASYRWQNGVALYHVIHITDFFGGAFTPDFLYNRFGPLMLLSYASLFVESLCVIFIWPKTTRLFTLVAVIGLHIGIELSMNMHCFEWLAMMGWMFFLAEPTFQKPFDSQISRHGITALLLILLTIFAIDTAPIQELCDAAPAIFEHARPIMERVKYTVQPKIVTPYLAPIGLSQDVWNMFMAAPDEVFTYEAVIKLYNDSEVIWNQPHWEDMNWLQKKRWQRPMTYYDTLADGHEWPVMEAFARGIANDHGGTGNVRSVLISVHIDRPPPPNGLGFFDKAKQRRFRQSTKNIFTLNLCDDFDARCPYWSRVGSCNAPQHWKVMVDSCRRSCELCYDTAVIHVGSRIALIYPDDQEYYAVTVVDVTNEGRRFRIEYDDYEFEYERYEWLDRIDMRFRKFKLLSVEEDPDMAEPTPLESSEPTTDQSQGYINRPVQLSAEVKVVNRSQHSSERMKIGEVEDSSAKSTGNADRSFGTTKTEDGGPGYVPHDPGTAAETVEDVPRQESMETGGAVSYSDPEHNSAGELETADLTTEKTPAAVTNDRQLDNASMEDEEATLEQAHEVVSPETSTAADSVSSDRTDIAAGTTGDQQSDYVGQHVKLNAEVKINPGMVWLNNPKKSSPNPSDKEQLDNVVNSEQGSLEDQPNTMSEGPPVETSDIPMLETQVTSRAEAADLKETLAAEFRLQQTNGLKDQPLIKLSAEVKVNPGMVWLNNPMKSDGKESATPSTP